MGVLRRGCERPWWWGTPAPVLGLDVRNLQRRVDDAGPGEMDEYPFSQGPV